MECRHEGSIVNRSILVVPLYESDSLSSHCKMGKEVHLSAAVRQSKPDIFQNNFSLLTRFGAGTNMPE